MDVEGLQRGKVSAYDLFKGFGFIRREKGRDVYFYYDDVQGKEEYISVGDYVEFDLRVEKKRA
ncbi:cold shock domain-containing protein [Pseudomonas sp. FP597]|uniref:cold shock domain-containing protein n=1 Tax=Pseudomonas sp. FP597 TaxID=2954096 RepID=UPI002734E21A|nr:cold shock domain-containing protein [Pseudomonas sp. FP597]WLI08353.1 cold shock domain-containing protein [Pseudomonas sp. FP597]